MKPSVSMKNLLGVKLHKPNSKHIPAYKLKLLVYIATTAEKFRTLTTVSYDHSQSVVMAKGIKMVCYNAAIFIV
jgi:hypothetical protein